MIIKAEVYIIEQSEFYECFPDTPQFTKFLSSLTIIAPDNVEEYTEVTAISEDICIDQFGVRKNEVSVKMWFRKDCGIKFSSVKKKLIKHLDYIQHPCDDQIAVIILAFYTLAKRTEENAVDALNQILLKIGQCDVSQYVITDVEIPAEFKVEFGDFSIHRFNSEKFKYRCGKTESNYYDLYGDSHVGKLTVEKKYFQIIIIDWNLVFTELDMLDAGTLIRRIHDTYFHLLAKKMWEHFWDSFVSSQHIYNAISNTYLDPFEILSISISNSFVTLFLNIGQKRFGFISPFGGTNNIRIGEFRHAIPVVDKMLTESYDFTKYDNHNPIHNHLKLFISMSQMLKYTCTMRDMMKASCFLRYPLRCYLDKRNNSRNQ